ncbi:hypothetical protein LKMONMHP_0858 [Methylobacterium organophilum]|uniref:Glycosyltransferase 2-like domain-containing protein n=1 Tax=Methylobacterium organophilum TaxID=410 RepID=A0ABQ4T645_METOR|nr:glycosyltransferase family 2 protein [Methylobacterium organophilum]GJE26014.1 hypothetical protein LKMONMHP_0858 [Methylobacterium organophilum]
MSLLAPPEHASLLLPPEIAFLAAQGVSRAILEKAAEQARQGGADAATTLLNTGLLSEEAFYRALARHLGVAFLGEAFALSEDTPYPQALRAGAAPLAAGSAHALVAAPRGYAVARLLDVHRELASPPAITTPTRLRAAVFALHADRIAADASDDLGRHHPEWSCRPGPHLTHLALVGFTILLGLVTARLPLLIGHLVLAATQILLIAMLSIRIAAVGVAASLEPRRFEMQTLADAILPTYTVLVALYREAAVVPRLIYTLSKLDYPAAKLDIKFLIEEGDSETAAALAAAPLPARFEVIVAPPGLPRTKPRALNIALPLARGDHLVVYDAEDVVDPGQLRAAAAQFARSPATTACLQGRLVIDNAADGWLTRFFAIEYAALFDVLGPALARWRMPTPLGGTSTHFRTQVLRRLHGWDPWNVTEDADLGIRLALAGYTVGDLPSSTYEEAPKRVGAWLRQRTRWMKGYLQTSFTHGRGLRKAWRRLGPLGFLYAGALLPGTVASALLYPFLMLASLYEMIAGPARAEFGLLATLTSLGSYAVFLGGAGAMLLPGLLGCLRRGWIDLLPRVPLMPVYFLLVGLAAWLAMFELVRHPFRWNKTEHGLSRTSRSGALHLRRRTGTVRAASSAPPPFPAPAG